jgi:hypothetical protein
LAREYEYEATNYRRVWQLAQIHAPALLKEIEASLQNLSLAEGTSMGETQTQKDDGGSKQ